MVLLAWKLLANIFVLPLTTSLLNLRPQEFNRYGARWQAVKPRQDTQHTFNYCDVTLAVRRLHTRVILLISPLLSHLISVCFGLPLCSSGVWVRGKTRFWGWLGWRDRQANKEVDFTRIMSLSGPQQVPDGASSFRINQSPSGLPNIFPLPYRAEAPYLTTYRCNQNIFKVNLMFLVYHFLRVLPKFRKASIKFVMFARLSACNNSAPNWADFH